ncbi:MAG: hypothetical protein JWN44_934 [Myxococcales bacterium]|nr:hypothetical protein [Myxococcales bacterium]
MVLQLIALTVGSVIAQADLPNANLPGNSPTLPNSDLPGSVPNDNPIALPSTDTSRDAQEARAKEADQAAWLRRNAEWQDQMQALTAKAVEEAAQARADLAEAKQALIDAIEQSVPSSAP